MPKKLKKYRQMRRPGKTPEPFGRVGTAGARRFVVQRHAARRLHYDLRLEWSGTLRSWAVPRGPSADPTQKRLAVKVEDHPIEYANFEGRIPEGNYGAGTVIVWDCGTWRPLEDPAAGMVKGKILFELDGYKLKGKWALVRIKKSEKEWLLIKEKDAYTENASFEYSNLSVFSGLENKHLEGRAFRPPWAKEIEKSKLPKAKARVEWTPPMLATNHGAAFDRPGWIHELKYDGYRVAAIKDQEGVRILTRNGNPVTELFPEVTRALKHLPATAIALDGELVVLDRESRPSFNALQKRFQLKKSAEIELASVASRTSLFCFDLLQLQGRDLRGEALSKRRAWLRQVLPDLGALRFSPEFKKGTDLFATARGLRLEGVVSKKAESPYVSGRSEAWLKIRCDRTGDFVVVGYTLPKRTRAGFGALLLAVYAGNKLKFAGRVGTGFNDKQLGAIRLKLDKLKTKTPAVQAGEVTSDTIQWVKPRVVAEIRYKQWNEHLRQASFLRLRDDKTARECTLEELDEAGATAEESPVLESPPQSVTVSNPDKIFWPKEKFTKQDLIDYYRAVAPWLLPYLKGRPLVLTRYPDGIEGKSFFQKDAPVFVPEWIRLEPIWSEHSQRDVKFFVCESVEALTYIINMGAIPLHLWASRADSLEHPDWSVLDLDPKGAPFKHVVRIAREIHAVCAEIGLPNYVKTSGSSGLHIFIPLGRQLTHEQSKTLAELLAGVVSRRLPEIATIVRMPSQRKGKVYIDFLQNGWGKTIAAPFCVRPLAGAPVSMPLQWKEVNGRLDISRFTLKTAISRLKKTKDPLLPILGERPDLARALKLLSKML